MFGFKEKKDDSKKIREYCEKDMFSCKEQLERTRSWKVLSWKVRNEIGKIEIEKFGPKLESTTEVGK